MSDLPPKPGLSVESPERILLVDDHPENLLALEAVLQPLGHQLVKASSGGEALKKLINGEFALVILDVMMPGLDGFETAKLLKQRERTRQIPILFLTAIHRQETEIIKGYACGAVDYLLKPIEPQVLRAKVNLCLDLYRKELQLRRLQELRREAELERDTMLARDREFERHLIGIVSHDLRNPLGIISLATSALLSADSTHKACQKAGHRIANACDRAHRLIRDLLDYTRMRSAGGIPIVPKAMQFHDFARQVVDEFRETQPERTIHLEQSGEGMGSWDPDRIRQVIENLVVNALQYSPPATVVRVKTCGKETMMVLEVHNEGEPIPTECLEDIFKPLMRRHQDQAASSVGLGLYIAQQIVLAHQGNIGVRSSDSEGTTFTVHLPRESARKEPGPEDLSNPSATEAASSLPRTVASCEGGI